ncbi:hypothetical protein [Litorihabitans aurantiacus]|uniref:PD-(D/E)XK endonuclease-like domain-containing protein n=1 Tax=Litorihabitans aurantiacus TaxID=1930061 RepID=A0AA37XE79_9MICO|nr:hypothetical protein [Litorihabitans aurantiacus]GMA31576.1 hypothetical protein GCM10025875_15680 [Litorihabitans aurantiacus]
MNALAVLPPLRQSYEGGTAADTHRDLRALLEDAIVNAPRSLQRTIGPSEIGTDCEHCLAAKIAGWEQTREGVAWLPFVGTAVHAEHERLVIEHENRRTCGNTTGSRRYLVEERVNVGTIGGVEISGSCDLFDIATGTTVDWKITGATTLRSARSGPSPVYRVQAHLYGRGLAAAGHTVKHVSIVYLPRNSAGGWADAVLWSEPYQEQIALDALARADRLHTNMTALQAGLGDQARDAWISSLPRAAGCYSCARYPDFPTPAADATLGGLLTPPTRAGPPDSNPPTPEGAPPCPPPPRTAS